MKEIKLGIIGIGNIGLSHANCIAKGEIKGLTLTAVCDINTEKTASFHKMYENVSIFSDYNDMFKSKEIDAVIISVPHPLHAEIAINALKSGLHVLLEKPADISVSRVKKLNELADKTDKTFAIMFNQRTNPLFAKAREIVKSGKLGELKRTVWIVTNWYRTQSYYDSGDWRATWAGEGGGVLLNQAPHNLDLWQWICGMPESITAFCDRAKFHDIEVEDDVTIFARYKNGATGVFITSTGEYPGTNRLEICGTKGKIVLEDGILKHWRLNVDEREIYKSSKENSPFIEYDYSETKQDEAEKAHKGILQNFANAVLYGEELISSGKEGIFELAISNAAYLSQWKGNAEIRIPFDCNEFDRLLDEKIAHSEYKSINTVKSSDGEYSKRWRVNW